MSYKLMGLEKTDEYRGKHKNVIFSIVLRNDGKKYWWTYYINIHEDLINHSFISKDSFERIWTKAGYEFDEIYFHEGITFFEKKVGYDSLQRALELGCDFNHLSDHNEDGSIKIVDLEEVLHEARITIESFWNNFGINEKQQEADNGH